MAIFFPPAVSNDIMATITITPVDDPPNFPIALGGGSNYNQQEDEAFVLGPFKVDEGGGSDEDSQDLTVEVLTSDSGIIQKDDIKIYYSDDDVLEAHEEIAHSSSVNSIISEDAKIKDLYLKITPIEDAVGNVTLTTQISDQSNAPVQDSFVVNIAEVDDVPILDMIGMRECKFSSYADEGSCDAERGCVGRTSPTTAGISGSVENLLYYNESNRRCYFADSTGAWDLLPVNDCPVTPSSELAACTGVNCIGTSSPRVIPTAIGQFYYDRVHNTCYKSTGINSDADWERYIQRSACNYTEAACNSKDCMGAGLPVVSPSADNMLYYDSYGKKCYISGAGLWAETSMQCRPDLNDTSNFDSGCVGTHCIGSTSPSGVVDPVAAGKYYFDKATKNCWVSTGTEASDWKIHRGALPSIETAERTPVIVNNLIIDEGGVGQTEDNDRLCLGVFSSNETIMPKSSIYFSRGDRRFVGSIKAGVSWVDFGDGNADARSFESLTMEIEPALPDENSKCLGDFNVTVF